MLTRARTLLMRRDLTVISATRGHAVSMANRRAPETATAAAEEATSIVGRAYDASHAPSITSPMNTMVAL